MRFAPLDLLILGAYLAGSLAVGLWTARRAGRSEESFFLAGRQLPWWLAAASLVATSFSIDTPLGIGGLVGANGVPGVWFAWCFALGGSGMLGYAFFAELWRRSGVLTDAAFVELRYGGRGAAPLRLFKAVYLGVLLNALTLAWILKAVMTLGTEVLGQPPLAVLAVVLALTLVYCSAAGLWGVAFTDLPQYVLALGITIVLAWRAVAAAGGLAGIQAALALRPEGSSIALGFMPPAGSEFFTTFLTYVLVLWWAHRNAAGSPVALQRFAACRDEREARRATLAFTIAMFAVTYWPMILLALAGLARNPALGGEQAVARLYYDGLPTGLLGLSMAALLAAFMSTVVSHMNLGAAYLVHDIVRRFLRSEASERELVRWGRVATGLMLVLAVAISLTLDSVAGAWQLLAALTAGYGLVTIVRWFWWRVSAWSEIAALASSAAAVLGLHQLRPNLTFGAELLGVVAVSTPVWLAVTWLAPPPDPATTAAFVERVRPWGRWPRRQATAPRGLG
ncbi:MAG: sodium:solute symporter family protein, partial [Thermoanaerobaculia bacterium]